MFGKLVPCGGGAPISLGKPTLMIGRNPDCDVPVVCKTVSGRHCELRFDEGAWWVRDLESKNGTSVNGIRCEKQRIAPNDVLTIGKQRFVVVYQGAEVKPGPAPAQQDIEALALAFLTSDEEPASAPRPQSLSMHPPHASTPHLHKKAALGTLVPCGGGDPIPLLLPELIFGRHPSCDICLAFPAVSAKHCKLSWQDGYWFVEDLGSRNGTFVNGVRCRNKCLVPAAVLGLAKHRYFVHYAATGTAPPPEEEDIFSQSLLEKAGLAKQFSSANSPGTAAAEDDPDQRVRYRLDADDL